MGLVGRQTCAGAVAAVEETPLMVGRGYGAAALAESDVDRREIRGPGIEVEV